ncbi:MAG: hypothetical protein Q8Q41_04600 [bacterium]|nr:hypothetical protein [bacterium]
MRFSTEEGESFCYEPIHTHDGAGILTLAYDERNDMTLGRFLKTWWPEIWQRFPKALVLADGARVEKPAELRITPGMDVKIFFLPESGHHH